MSDLSFVIPAFNEKRFISSCLSEIKKLCAGHKLAAEIIVIDNGSTDNTRALAEEYADTVTTIERQSVSVARNVGIEAASSELIAFIDADVILTSEWFECFLKHKDEYLKKPDFIAGHQYAVRPNGTWIEKYWFGNIKDKLLNGGNIITSKQLCEKIGGFDGNLKTSEDYDFCERAIASGAYFIVEPGYVAIHEGFPRDVRNFYRREYWHGEGDYRSFQSFIGSIAAILGVGYLFMTVLLAILLASCQVTLFVCMLGLLLAVNLAVTFKRFSGVPVNAFISNYILHFVYFLARGMSLFKALRNRKLSY